MSTLESNGPRLRRPRSLTDDSHEFTVKTIYDLRLTPDQTINDKELSSHNLSLCESTQNGGPQGNLRVPFLVFF